MKEALAGSARILAKVVLAYLVAIVATGTLAYLIL